MNEERGHLSITWVLETLRLRATHVRNVGSYFVERILALSLYFISVPIFIERQGSGAYGTLTLLLLVFSYTQFFDLGIGYAVNQRLGRAVARKGRHLITIVQTAVPVFAVFGIVFAAAVFAFSQQLALLLFGRPEHSDAIRAVAFAMGLLTLDVLPVSLLQAHNRVDWINYSRLVIDVTRALGILAGAFAVHGIAVAVGFTIGGVVVKLLIDIVLSGRLLAGRFAFKPVFSARSNALNLHLGMPVVSSVFFGMLMTSIDRIFVSRVFGQGALAHYAVGADLCSKAYFLVWAITGSVYTLYVRRRAKRQAAEDLIRVSLIAVAIVTVVFYLPLAVFAREVIGIWINPVFAAQSAEITRIWALAGVAYLITCVYSDHLRGYGKPGLLAISGGIGISAVITGLMTLPRWFHVAGAALAVLIGFLGQALFLWQCSRKVRRETMTS